MKIEPVLRKLAGGMDIGKVDREYGVKTDDIYAALSYAASLVASDEVRATT